MTDPLALDADAAHEPRRARWERWTEWPLMLAARGFLVVYAWPILDPTLDPAAARACRVVGFAIWLAFAADYAVRLLLSRHRGRYVRENVFALVVIAVPMLRPLRLLQVLTLLTVLNRYAGRAFRGRVIAYIVCSAGLLIFVSALAMLQTERRAAGARITDVGDALWWAMTTVTTVGYGDEYPVTAAGRVIAAALMIAGVALVGAVTATFASWLIERVADEDEAADPAEAPATAGDVAALRQEIAALRADLAARESD